MVSFIGLFSHLLLDSQTWIAQRAIYRRKQKPEDASGVSNDYAAAPEVRQHRSSVCEWIRAQTHIRKRYSECTQIEQIKRCPDTNNEYVYGNVYKHRRTAIAWCACCWWLAALSHWADWTIYGQTATMSRPFKKNSNKARNWNGNDKRRNG